MKYRSHSLFPKPFHRVVTALLADQTTPCGNYLFFLLNIQWSLKGKGANLMVLSIPTKCCSCLCPWYVWCQHLARCFEWAAEGAPSQHSWHCTCQQIQIRPLKNNFVQLLSVRSWHLCQWEWAQVGESWTLHPSRQQGRADEAGCWQPPVPVLTDSLRGSWNSRFISTKNKSVWRGLMHCRDLCRETIDTVDTEIL